MPKETIRLLKDLVGYGLTDSDFRIVHHMRDATIERHRTYCTRTSQFLFDDATNSKVRDRLRLIAKAFRAGGFSNPAKPGVLAELAKAAVAEIPKCMPSRAATVSVFQFHLGADLCLDLRAVAGERYRSARLRHFAISRSCLAPLVVHRAAGALSS